MRILRWFLVAAAASCTPAEADTTKASFVVSATVIDNCIVRSAERRAQCSAGAPYQLRVTPARIVVTASPAGQLTGVGNHAQMAISDALIPTSGADWPDAGIDRAQPLEIATISF